MSLFSKEHYELMAEFEKVCRDHCNYARLDKEPKASWEKGVIYQSGEVNNLFLLFRKAYALGKTAN